MRGEPDQAVINYARLFDLTIVGQYENLTGADEMELHPDHIAYASGRPIIVVPKYFQPASIVEHSVVAWGQIEPYSLP